MNILYLNHYAGSPAHGMEFRPYYLAREWARAGHAVQMLAASFSHVRAVQPVMPAGGGPLDERIDGIAYRWYPTPAYQGNGVARVKNILAFCAAVWRDTARIVREFRPDVVIASSTYPMDIWVARRLARRANATLVFEVHDLWPLSPIELSGMSPSHPFIRLVSWAEGTAYRQSDVVVSMLPCVHDYMASRGLDLQKLAIVPNGISPDDWAAAPAPLREDVAAAIASARAKGHTVVGYAGSMGLPNALDVLLDAAAQLRDEPASIVLVGDGHERVRLAARVASDALANVRFLPPIPKAQVPSFLAAIDIAYIGWQRVPIYRFGIAPNKLMDYLMAGRAVLHSVAAGNDPVAEAGCGVTVPPEDAGAVADGLRRLAAAGADERAAMGARGRAYVLAHHTYPVLARRFVDAVMSAKTRAAGQRPAITRS
jgi:glycosyltransferase involved in cell wall biosynthesis